MGCNALSGVSRVRCPPECSPLFAISARTRMPCPCRVGVETGDRPRGRPLGGCPQGEADRGWLEAKVRIERDARKYVHVVVFATFSVLDENSRAIAVAALRRRIGAEIDRARGEASVVLNVG